VNRSVSSIILFTGLVMSILIVNPFVMPHAYAYSSYMEYSRAFNRCKALKVGRAQCLEDANTRYHCTNKSDDEDQCLLNYSRELYDQVQTEKAERQAKLNAEQERKKAQHAAWSQEVKERKPYGVGKWTVREGKRDPIDDSRVVVASLIADSGTAHLGGEKIKIIIRCQSNKTEFYIDWHDYITDSTVVTHRFDGEKAITNRWSSSTDKTSSFYYGAGVEITKKLMTTDRFVARTTPFSENPVTAIFDVRGLALAVEPLRDACNW